MAIALTFIFLHLKLYRNLINEDNTHFILVKSRVYFFRRWYKARLPDRVLEFCIKKNPRKGARFLKILPFTE